MGEYIEREAILEKCGWYNLYSGGSVCAISKKEVAELPAADVVEVVRCGECIHNYGVKANCEFNPHDIVCDWWSTDGMDETDFCSRGERRSE